MEVKVHGITLCDLDGAYPYIVFLLDVLDLKRSTLSS